MCFRLHHPIAVPIGSYQVKGQRHEHDLKFVFTASFRTLGAPRFFTILEICLYLLHSLLGNGKEVLIPRITLEPCTEDVTNVGLDV